MGLRAGTLMRQQPDGRVSLDESLSSISASTIPVRSSLPARGRGSISFDS